MHRVAVILLIILSSVGCFAQGGNTNHGQQENFIGTQLMSLGLYDEAIKHHLDALAYFERNKMTAEVVRTKNNIFQVYFRTHRLKDGEDILLDAMSQVNHADTMLRVSILNNLGIVYAATQRYEKALEAYNRTLELGHDNPEAQSSAYINIADLYFQQGEYKKAEHYLDEGLKIPQSRIKPTYKVQMYLNMALLGVAQGNRSMALTYVGKARGLLPELPRATKINALAQIADIHLNLSDSITALRYILDYESLRDSV